MSQQLRCLTRLHRAAREATGMLEFSLTHQDSLGEYIAEAWLRQPRAVDGMVMGREVISPSKRRCSRCQIDEVRAR